MPEGDETGGGTPKGGGSLEARLSVFDSIGNSIENLVEGVKSIPTVIRGAAYYTYYTAKAVAGMGMGVAIAGLPGLILPTFMSLGTYLKNKMNKVETKFSQIANELCIGGLLGGFLHTMFGVADYLGGIVSKSYGKIAGAATRAIYGLTALIPFIRTHEYLNRFLTKGYKPKSFKEQWKESKSMLFLLSPFVAAQYALEISKAAKMGMAGGISLAYGLLKGGKKKEEQTETQKLQDQYNQLQQKYNALSQEYAKSKAA